MQSNPTSFFIRLPYDIRVIIYAYLEPTGEGPPFRPGFSSPAFRLTCRQALEEITDRPKEQLATFLADFKAKTKVDLVVTSRADDLHNIVVTIPFSAIHNNVGHGQQKYYVGWNEEYRKAVEPLLALCFNTVRIHIGTKEDKDAPDHATLLDRGRVDVSMHRLMRILVEKIERTNEIEYAKQEAGRVDANTATRPLEQGNITTPVRARRISLSWDLRDDKSETNVVLNGRLHQSRNLGRQSFTAEAIARRERAAEKLSEEETSQALDQGIDVAHYPRTLFYHVRDTQRLVGLMCVQSSRRWTACEDGFFLNEALNALMCTTEYVSCISLNGHLQKGLTAVDEEDFEIKEKEVTTVLWET